jgi:hypothetical protein
LVARSLDIGTCRPEEVYALSTLFGVSYGSFVTHMERTLNLIDMHRASVLANHLPKKLRASLLGRPCPENLVVVDQHWNEKPIDVEVGDTILLPKGIQLEGDHAAVVGSNGAYTEVVARAPGICRVSSSNDWAAFVRVSRKDYVGLATYRFDEDIDDEQ